MYQGKNRLYFAQNELKHSKNLRNSKRWSFINVFHLIINKRLTKVCHQDSILLGADSRQLALAKVKNVTTNEYKIIAAVPLSHVHINVNVNKS